MKFKHLEGLIAAPFTPMLEDGSLNLELIPAYYNHLKNKGITGAFICGSTGEGVSLTTEEKKLVAQAWASCTNHDDDFKVMTLVGGTCLADCKALAKHAAEIGLYGVSFTAPYYFKPAKVSSLAEMCAEIAAEVPNLPFYYYHIPVLNGVSFNMIDLLQEIDGKIDNFAGIKYTHEDFMDFLSCLQFKNKKYDMLWGRDENMLPALVLGAKGAVGSTYNYAPDIYTELINAFKKNDLIKAQNLQHDAINVIRLLGKHGGIATGKAYMKLIGLDCGGFRLPIKNMSNEQFKDFKKDVEELNLSIFNFPQSLNH